MTLTRTIELERSTRTRITFVQSDGNEARVTQLRQCSAELIEPLKKEAALLGRIPYPLAVRDYSDSLSLENSRGRELAWVLLSADLYDEDVQALVDATLVSVLSMLVVRSPERGAIRDLRVHDEIELTFALDGGWTPTVWKDRVLRFH